MSSPANFWAVPISLCRAYHQYEMRIITDNLTHYVFSRVFRLLLAFTFIILFWIGTFGVVGGRDISFLGGATSAKALAKPTSVASDNTKPLSVAEKHKDANELVVFVTRTGSKYHKKQCWHLKRSRIAVSLRQALEYGYKPCKFCWRDDSIRPKSDCSDLISSLEDAGNRPDEGGLIPGSLIRVIDGDTVVMEIEGSVEHVRLIGIDAPELRNPNKGRADPLAFEAKRFMEKLMAEFAEEVFIEKDVGERDRYGRLLAYIWILPRGGEKSSFMHSELWMRSPLEAHRAQSATPTTSYQFSGRRLILVNSVLIAEGHARPMTIPPNVKYAETFRRIFAKLYNPAETFADVQF